MRGRSVVSATLSKLSQKTHMLLSSVLSWIYCLPVADLSELCILSFLPLHLRQYIHWIAVNANIVYLYGNKLHYYNCLYIFIMFQGWGHLLLTGLCYVVFYEANEKSFAAWWAWGLKILLFIQTGGTQPDSLRASPLLWLFTPHGVCSTAATAALFTLRSKKYRITVANGDC